MRQSHAHDSRSYLGVGAAAASVHRSGYRFDWYDDFLTLVFQQIDVEECQLPHALPSIRLYGSTMVRIGRR